MKKFTLINFIKIINKVVLTNILFENNKFINFINNYFMKSYYYLDYYYDQILNFLLNGPKIHHLI